MYEQVRERAFAQCESDEDPLDFFAAALELGADEAEAERIDVALTRSVMQARGAI